MPRDPFSAGSTPRGPSLSASSAAKGLGLAVGCDESLQDDQIPDTERERVSGPRGSLQTTANSRRWAWVAGGVILVLAACLGIELAPKLPQRTADSEHADVRLLPPLTLAYPKHAVTKSYWASAQLHTEQPEKREADGAYSVGALGMEPSAALRKIADGRLTWNDESQKQKLLRRLVVVLHKRIEEQQRVRRMFPHLRRIRDAKVRACVRPAPCALVHACLDVLASAHGATAHPAIDACGHAQVRLLVSNFRRMWRVGLASTRGISYGYYRRLATWKLQRVIREETRRLAAFRSARRQMQDALEQHRCVPTHSRRDIDAHQPA